MAQDRISASLWKWEIRMVVFLKVQHRTSANGWMEETMELLEMQHLIAGN